MIGLVDCNNFYASCERLFQPQLRNTPIVVLSNNDGCVIARSNEAKALGIKMGAPAFEIEQLLKQHRVAVFSSNYTLYGDLSARVMAVLGRFTPNIEVYSIDEAFLDLAGLAFTDLEDYVAKIRQTIKQWVGIPVGIGVGATKSLAKAANKYAKKVRKEAGVFVIDCEEKRREVLQWLPVGDIWGVGRRYASWLQEHGIKTALDFANADTAWVRKRMSVVGERLVRELNGTPCIDLEMITPAKQNICTSRSFGTLVKDKETLMQAVATFATRCAEKLRRQESCTGNIYTFIHTNAYRTQDEQYHAGLAVPLLTPTSDTTELVRYARIALDRIYKPGMNYKKAGVIVSEIVPQSAVQRSIFDSRNRARDSRIMAVLDAVNGGMGQDKLRVASAGFGRTWKLRQERLSPCYTTNPAELLKIRI